MKLKRLVEDKQLNESTYGLVDNIYTSDQLMKIALGGYMLDKILDPDQSLLPGFTVHSNSRGSGIQKLARGMDSTAVVHHIGRKHGDDQLVGGFKDSDMHNVMHSKILKLVQEYLKDDQYVFDMAYKNYLSDFESANRKIQQSINSKDMYASIGLRFMAFENYFRFIHNYFMQNERLDEIKSYVQSVQTDLGKMYWGNNLRTQGKLKQDMKDLSQGVNK